MLTKKKKKKNQPNKKPLQLFMIQNFHERVSLQPPKLQWLRTPIQVQARKHLCNLFRHSSPVRGLASRGSAVTAKGPQKMHWGSAGLPEPPPEEGYWENQQQPPKTNMEGIRNHRASDIEMASWLSSLSSSKPLIPSFLTFYDQEHNEVLEIWADYGFMQ